MVMDVPSYLIWIELRGMKGEYIDVIHHTFTIAPVIGDTFRLSIGRFKVTERALAIGEDPGVNAHIVAEMT
jgi:hypothetical protein